MTDRERIVSFLEPIATGRTSATIERADHFSRFTSVFSTGDGGSLIVYFDGGPTIDYIDVINFPDGESFDFDRIYATPEGRIALDDWLVDEPWWTLLEESLWGMVP